MRKRNFSSTTEVARMREHWGRDEGRCVLALALASTPPTHSASFVVEE